MTNTMVHTIVRLAFGFSACRVNNIDGKVTRLYGARILVLLPNKIKVLANGLTH